MLEEASPSVLGKIAGAPLGALCAKVIPVPSLHSAANRLALLLIAAATIAAPPALAQKAGEEAWSIHKHYAAAQRGDAVAQRNVGLIYAFGYGVPMNKVEGAKWLRLAANQGDAKAAYHLAWMYRTGQGVALDYAEATRLETRAAERGYLPAQVSLGRVHLQSNNTFEAEKWFKRAAERGDLEARHQLIVLYATGATCDCDFGGLNYQAGVAWIRQLAGHGDPAALWALGLIAHRGTKNPSEAYIYYMLAAARGNAEAEKLALEVAPGLTEAQRSAARSEILRRLRQFPN